MNWGAMKEQKRAATATKQARALDTLAALGIPVAVLSLGCLSVGRQGRTASFWPNRARWVTHGKGQEQGTGLQELIAWLGTNSAYVPKTA
ncbi:MAG: hypothetical protein COA38_20535 [Fluviicola sp.]|nr:MAG: hypothetical protein COA38_20535 [Fluviicola sp.]